jgi:uncharacterized protein YidB (DUF937 family)
MSLGAHSFRFGNRMPGEIHRKSVRMLSQRLPNSRTMRPGRDPAIESDFVARRPGRNGRGRRMGLLDSLLEGVTTTAQSGPATAGAGAGLLEVATQLVKQHPGGIQGLVNQLAQAGLGREAQSWVGSGKNLPVSAAQIAKALGGANGGQLTEILNQLGISQNDAMGGLAKVLPELVNQLTPQGHIEPSANLERSLGIALKKFV